MKNQNLSSLAWILQGLIGSTEGVLTLQNERLSFADDGGQIVFDAPIGEVRELNFPWHLFGCGLTFVIGADNYRISFARPGNTSSQSGLGDVFDGRNECKKWKSTLI